MQFDLNIPGSTVNEDGADAGNDTHCADAYTPSVLEEVETNTDDGGAEDNINHREEATAPDRQNVLTTSIEELEAKLAPGSTMINLSVVYMLYCEYGRLVGFSVRKGVQEYFSHSTEVRIKLFVCHCEGRPDGKASKDRLPQYKKQQRRTCCRARLCVVRTKDGPWRVSDFQKNHNHELLEPDQGYLLRSSRRLTDANTSIIDAFRSAGIGVGQSYRFMEKQSGGVQNIGFTKKDAYDHVHRTKLQTRVPNKDASALMQYFREKASKEPNFYCNVMMDDEGRIMNFFVRDSRSKLDYESFRDVITVDTTFKTNKYNLVCTPFVGVNHHRSNVLFGIAFMSDETTASFEWLFTTFLESMEGEEPQTIFSDQCQALMNGIDFCFMSVAHRLCQWHISQNAPTHFGTLNNNREFRRMWFHCMNACETEDEFEGTWGTMIERYQLSEKSWFNAMYNLRKRWASVFTNDRFSAGMHATSRSESVNKVLKALCKCTSSLYEVITQYEAIQQDWRTRERAEDAFCLGTPGQFLNDNPILKHAAALYTRTVYRQFEVEAAHSMNVNILQQVNKYTTNEWVYQVSCSSAIGRTRVVRHSEARQVASCSCQKWETDGILCRHILKIFFTINLPRVPDQYILKRWSKSARNRARNPDFTQTEAINGVDVLFVNEIMRLTHATALECKDNCALRCIMHEQVRGLYNEICGSTYVHGKRGPAFQCRQGYNEADIGVRNPRKRSTRQCGRKKKTSKVNGGRMSQPEPGCGETPAASV
ncbi:hypothetical protein C2S51_037765 [Perilla frutescens var. frutescens]|nr:hypothetical protein C2S51_037765 [Perilla frutescens var. frutescens]